MNSAGPLIDRAVVTAATSIPARLPPCRADALPQGIPVASLLGVQGCKDAMEQWSRVAG
jgi:hypothetical protein